MPVLQKMIQPKTLKALIDDKTKAIYLETIGNPGFAFLILKR
jgi:O-acetylhomoserine/O-acetylserine sulfhydrylase-like pyridoxal-dependent enzyme